MKEKSHSFSPLCPLLLDPLAALPDTRPVIIMVQIIFILSL
jgi:hypothetical protein